MQKKLIFISLIIFFLISCKDGYHKYIKLLQEVHRGLTPYWIPNPSDGPGAILEEINGAEQLVYDQKSAFPNLEIRSDNVPTFNLMKVSEIKVKGGAKANINKILNTDVEASIKFSFTKDTSMSLSIDNPKLHRIETGIITEALKSFDISIARQDEILKKLMQPNVRLICGAIYVKGFTFTFDNATNLESEEEVKLPNSLANQNLKYKKISNTKFSLEAATPMYIAYYAYKVNVEELKQFYEELKKTREACMENNEIDQIETKAPTIKSSLASLPQLKLQRGTLSKDIENLRDNEKLLANNLANARDEGTRRKIGNQLNQIRREIRINEERLSKLDTEIQPIERYELLTKKVAQNENFINEFAKKEYRLFKEEVIIPKKIEEIVKKK